MADGYTPNEIMTIEAARRLKNGTVCFLDPGSTKYPDACLQAYQDSGIRVILGECVTDQERTAEGPLSRVLGATGVGGGVSRKCLP